VPIKNILLMLYHKVFPKTRAPRADGIRKRRARAFEPPRTKKPARAS